jgi:beta-glucosidase
MRVLASLLLLGVASATDVPPYLDTSLPTTQRVQDLLSRLTPSEKAAQLQPASPGIDRLGISPYVWPNECLHGVASPGIATVFPQAIGLAAAWDASLHGTAAAAIGDEVRALHHEFARHGDYSLHTGLTCWSPNINIYRDPRWGRGQETYGEDPYLTGTLAAQFVRGLQGDDPRYLKSIATPKHDAVYSGPERLRHSLDVAADPFDLADTYLPAIAPRPRGQPRPSRQRRRESRASPSCPSRSASPLRRPA